MHMVDPASFVLTGLQDMILDAFGPTLGWIVGNLILLLFTLFLIWIIQNRNHIVSQSGWGYPNLMDISVIVFLTVL